MPEPSPEKGRILSVAAEPRQPIADAATVDDGAPGWPRAPFRPDIQGLRGLAVLLVVACHAGLPVRAGFIGVDVFFVVSGFVITGELLAELRATGTVRLRDFYARRARRLLPTLTVVTVVTLAVGALVLNPYGPQDLAVRTATAGTGFVANLYLYRHVGYFDSWLDNRNPFLHLWSLSVEEQFYLVLPIGLVLAWRALGGRADARRSDRRDPLERRRRGLLVVVAVVSAASFVLAWLCTSGRSPFPVQAPTRLAFYGVPTRIWEFGAGILLALLAPWVHRLGRSWAVACGWVGLIVLVGWAVALDPVQPFPGLTAVPAVGAAVLLVAAGGQGPVGRMLASAPWRWTGDRSYGWYLWHWPAVVFAGQVWPGSSVAPVLAAVASLGVAAVTYRAFEDRLRRDRSLVGRRAVRLTVVCLAASVAAVGLADAGVRSGYGLTEPDGWYDYSYGHDNGCLLFNRDLPNQWLEDRCTIPADPGRAGRGLILVLGDQHADSTATAVVAAAQPLGYDVAQWTRASCPMLDRAPVGYLRCTDWQRDALAAVRRLHPALVVIANRSPAYVDDLRDDTTVADDQGRRPRTRKAALAAWADGLDGTLDDLDRLRVPALVVAAGPDFGAAFARDRLSVVHPHAVAPVRTRAQEERRRGGIVAAERRVVAAHAHARLIDPLGVLCPDGRCEAAPEGLRWNYYDHADLNATGARRLILLVAGALGGLLPPR